MPATTIDGHDLEAPFAGYLAGVIHVAAVGAGARVKPHNPPFGLDVAFQGNVKLRVTIEKISEENPTNERAERADENRPPT